MKLPIEYLIEHEDELDWDKLSSDRDNPLSLVEVKLFRNKINWSKYLFHNKDNITDDILEMGCKSFNQEIYDQLARYNIAGKSFILKHKDKFDYDLLIRYSNVDEDTLLECVNMWYRRKKIKDTFEESKILDINSDKFTRIKLMLEYL